MFSVSIIYSAKDFLVQIDKNSITPNEFEEAFQVYKYGHPEQILKLSFKCGWTYLTPRGSINLTARGEEISVLDYSEALFLQLEDMVACYNPGWASLLPKGREETRQFLPKNVHQCFEEANLFGPLNDQIIRCWDKLALAYRNYNQQKLLEIGRDGESLSLQYEFKRTNQKPLWQSVESNLSGFDILSVISKDDSTPLKIEVKSTSSKLTYAQFHVSKNEWQTSELSLNYVFHLWDLKTKTLFLTPKDLVAEHIPDDNGSGDWREVRIPFERVIQKSERIEL